VEQPRLEAFARGSAAVIEFKDEYHSDHLKSDRKEYSKREEFEHTYFDRMAHPVALNN
jgi:hypothetical protein